MLHFYIDKHHLLRDGRWDSAIDFCVCDGGRLTTRPVVPAVHIGPFATEAEAIACNAALFRTALRTL
jgi:hypothetical protein